MDALPKTSRRKVSSERKSILSYPKILLALSSPDEKGAWVWDDSRKIENRKSRNKPLFKTVLQVTTSTSTGIPLHDIALLCTPLASEAVSVQHANAHRWPTVTLNTSLLLSCHSFTTRSPIHSLHLSFFSKPIVILSPCAG